MAWNNAVVTNRGVELLQEAAENGVLTFVSASGSDSTYPNASLMAQTAPSNEKQTFSITKISNVSGGKKLCVQITNKGLPHSYFMKQLCIWAKVNDDAPEVLAIIQDETGIQIPAESEISDFLLKFYALLKIDNVAEMNVTVDGSCFATVAALEEHEKDIASHLTSKAQTFSGVKTFEQAPMVPEPTKPGNPVRKEDLDAHVNDKASHITEEQKKVWDAKINAKDINTANGVAGLDENGEIEEAQIPNRLSDENIFSNTAAQLLGLSGEHATPNEAFIKLAIPDGYYAYGITVTVDGQPLSGVLVEGVKTFASLPAYTNADGYVLGMSNSSSVTLSIGGFADLKDFSRSYTAGGGVITNIAIEMQLKGINRYEITSSKIIKLSPLITKIDVFGVGGGGSGEASTRRGGAAGGGGGYTKTVFGIFLNGETTIETIIGSGGRSVGEYGDTENTSGNSGGSTIVKVNSKTVLNVLGGKGGWDDCGGDGGSGAGSGVRNSSRTQAGRGGSDGSDGNSNISGLSSSLMSSGQGKTTRAFEDSSEPLFASGGGGAYCDYTRDKGLDGYGGSGAGKGNGRYGGERTVRACGGDAKTAGSGGGAAVSNNRYDNGEARSGSGMHGIVIVRWRY